MISWEAEEEGPGVHYPPWGPNTPQIPHLDPDKRDSFPSPRLQPVPFLFCIGSGSFLSARIHFLGPLYVLVLFVCFLFSFSSSSPLVLLKASDFLGVHHTGELPISDSHTI